MDSISVNLENLSEQERESLMKLIEKANKSKSKVWKPTHKRETYYSIKGTGNVVTYVWNDDDMDAKIYEIGNCFRTQTEAEEEVTRLKMLKYWKDLSIESGEDENPWDTYQYHFYVGYQHDIGQLRICSSKITQYESVCFKSENACRAAIKELGEDNVKKYILGIKN